ncbi:SDR family NAD(P)-dependent oxidoreductase [Nonomuraea sp. NPDC046802]|uniref:SDR family oxidoreductase n=1 Tax=Nonomuraea sp. NPDC046802 TaxID=3154919 RepID=UPI0033C4338B
MEKLAGQTVFITGGAQGIGLGIARTFAREGARLALADIDKAHLAAARTRVPGAEAVKTFELDVRDRAAFEQVADQVENQLGPVSVLCNNAGIRVPDRLPELSYEVWDLVIGVNLEGVYNGIQTFLPRMLAHGGPGHIVNVSSAAGLAIHPNSRQAGSSGITYRASKSAVIGLSEALRFDLEAAGHAVGVSVVCPGLVSTKISSNSAVRAHLSAEQRQLAERGDAALAQLGQQPDIVGMMVINAVRANQLYVHTDRTMIEAVQERTAEILDVMPQEEVPQSPLTAW